MNPVGAVLDKKWFAIWSLAKVRVVDSSADFTLIFNNKEVCDGLIGQGLLGLRNKLSVPLTPHDLSWHLGGADGLKTYSCGNSRDARPSSSLLFSHKSY